MLLFRQGEPQPTRVYYNKIDRHLADANRVYESTTHEDIAWSDEDPMCGRSPGLYPRKGLTPEIPSLHFTRTRA